ncbi:MAG: restriction endonuclease subunit S, partial [Hyphomonadaceae bacterium]|nr:restriction endonuclease subunit S [Hyphomonadaceae bacterium]
ASEDYSGIGKAIEIVETSHIPLVAGLHTFIARPVGGSFFCGFAGYCLGSEGVRLQIRRVAQGISVLGISKYELEKLTLPLPSLAEQREIVGCLSSLDDLIEARKGQVAALKLHKRGLMQRLFPAPGGTTPALRFPGFRDAPPWEVKRLGEAASVRSGFAFKKQHWTETGVPVVKNTNVKPGGLDMSGCSFVSESTALSVADFSLQEGDILISMTGHVGQLVEVRSNNLPAMLNQRVGRFTIKDIRRLDGRFLYYSLAEPKFRRKLEVLGYGSAQMNVSPTAIHGIKIPLPSLPEQREIAGCLSSLDDLIEARKGQVAALKLHKRGLMQRLFPAPGATISRPRGTT